MNICSYTPLPYLDQKAIDARFRLLFKDVCYLLSGGGVAGVSSFNTSTGAITLQNGTNTTVTNPSPGVFQVNSTGSGTNYWTKTGNDITNNNTGNVNVNTPGFVTSIGDINNTNAGTLMTIDDGGQAITFLGADSFMIGNPSSGGPWGSPYGLFSIDLSGAGITLGDYENHGNSLYISLFNTTNLMSLSAPAGIISIGDVSGIQNKTLAIIDDTAEVITLSASNGVKVSNLAGTGTRMVTVSSTGILTQQAIPGGTGTVTSVTSANSDISVATGTTTPVLTLNSGSGANQIVKRDGSGNISSVGIISSGTWNGTAITNSFLANSSITINGTSIALGASGSFSTSAVSEGTNLYFTNARTLASTLTGYTSGAGTISSSDSVLTAIEKLNGNINALPTPTNYWTETGSNIENNNTGNVSINTPNLVTTIGDVVGGHNNFFLTVNDSIQDLRLNSTGGQTRIGDTISSGNNTILTVDDFSSNFVLTTGTTTISSAIIGAQQFKISANNSSIVLQPNTTLGATGSLVVKQNNISGTTTLNSPSNTGSYNIVTSVNSTNGNATNGNVPLNFTGGDVSSASAGSNTLTLATVNTNTGSWGIAASVPTFTVNGKGLITAAANTPIQIAESQVTNLTTDLAAKEPILTFNSPLSRSVNTISIPVATTSVNGYLSSTDWTTFNGKVSTIAVSTANGVSGTSSGGTTPSLTIALGAITPTTINGNTITTGTGTLTIAAGKTLTANNTLTLAGTDSSTLNIGTGGTLGTAAFTPASNYVAVNGSTPLTGNWNAGAFNIQTTQTATASATTLDGFDLINTTTASATNQMYSPSIHFQGQGWKTTTTAASQAVDCKNYLVPVQGTTAPTSQINWDFSINGGSYTTQSSLNSAGNFAVVAQINSMAFSSGSMGYAATIGTITKCGFNWASSGLVNFGGLDGSGYFPAFLSSGVEAMRIPVSTNILIGTTTDVTTSKLTVVSTTKGTIVNPLMTTSQRTAISSPATGLEVYQTDGLEGRYTNTSTGWFQTPNSLTASGTLTFGATGAGAKSDQTVTLTGAVVGDVVAIGVPAVPANGVFFGWVSSTNTVTIRFANTDTLTSYTPTVGTYTVKILR